MECHEVVWPTFTPRTSKDFGSLDAVPVGRRVAPPLLRAMVERLGQFHRDGEPLELCPKNGVVAALLRERSHPMARSLESRQG